MTLFDKKKILRVLDELNENNDLKVLKDLYWGQYLKDGDSPLNHPESKDKVSSLTDLFGGLSIPILNQVQIV